MGQLGELCRSPTSFKTRLLVILVLADVFSHYGAAVRAATEQVEKKQSFCQDLDPSPVLEPFVDELIQPPQIDVSTGSQLILGAYKIKQKLHRDLPETTLYAYGTSQEKASSPGPTLLATRGIVSCIRWENHIDDVHHFLQVDDSLHWARPKGGGVPIATHLHGGEVVSESDGHPDSWCTCKGDVGPSYTTNNNTYANSQLPALLWYHDHTVGITRLNMLSGLNGLYLLRSPSEEPDNLPCGEFEKVLVLQDKQFWADGSINFPNVGVSPHFHPSWCPEYYGDTILVNGKAWPYVNVYPTKYRFRLLNAANARFFVLSLNHPKLRFIQIGTDRGFLHKSRELKSLTVGPAERVDFVVDFGKLESWCSEVVLNNSGEAPYPVGDPAFSPPSTKAVLKFNVLAVPENVALEQLKLPKTLGPKGKISTSRAIRKRMTLTESDDGDGNPVGSFLNGLRWMDPLTDTPEMNSTEIWEIINLTNDAHPVHIHLIAFRVKSQQSFDTGRHGNKNCSLDKQFPDPKSCYTESPQRPYKAQQGWKDTAVVYPGKVTLFAVRWTTQCGDTFPFDATSGPGYVWHCHILDHEDNDMMRPLKVVNSLR